ncbi:MAG: hypothetical protein Ta2A_04310 [Treponemataceae bacterium]|nr:MAG: hypothetical protein Ta2A_04310 [Treponemataceae bacterium]
MAEDNKPRAVYAPGELDKVRKNIGSIDPEEAKRLQKKLGGVVGVEKDAEVPNTIAKKPPLHKGSEKLVNSPISKTSGVSGSGARSSSGGQSSTGGATERLFVLPSISKHERNRMDRIMMMSDYGIKTSFGIFNFFVFMSAKRIEKLNQGFVTRVTRSHMRHIKSFVEACTNLYASAPPEYKAYITSSPTIEQKFKVLKKISGWQRLFPAVELEAAKLEGITGTVLVNHFAPFVKALYRILIELYFIDMELPGIFREIASDIVEFSDIKRDKILSYSRTAVNEWQYVYEQVINGLYPLLMRMCSHESWTFPTFFSAAIQNILPFLGLTKYDLLMPESEAEKKSQASTRYTHENAVTQSAEKKTSSGGSSADGGGGAASAAEAEETECIPQSGISLTGIKLLEVLFPGAGWTDLGVFPDMYPYFQPLYKFHPGFSALAPENPVQTALVLMRIVDDLLYGCRGIQFKVNPKEMFGKKEETFTEAIFDWPMYQDILFDSHYGLDLDSFVSGANGNVDFINSPFGKKKLANLYWQTKSLFFPNIHLLRLLTTEDMRGASEMKVSPLNKKIDFIKRSLTSFITAIEQAEGAHAKEMNELGNPWEAYHFEVPNPVSARLDILLGAKKGSPKANNANLLKYVTAIVSVLDWWVNNPRSPVYKGADFPIYRVAVDDGGVGITPPVRSDQTQLFRNALQRNAQEHEQSKAG